MSGVSKVSGLSILIGLTALWLASPSAAQTDSLPYTLALPAAQSSLFRVDQHGTDFRVLVDDGESVRIIDHPMGTTGPELFLLGPYPEERIVNVTVESKYLNQGVSDSAPIPLGTVDSVESWRRFSLAGALAFADDQASQERALAIYQELGGDPGLVAAGRDYSQLPYYLAAIQSYRLFNIDSTMTALDDMEEDCVVAPYCYKQRLLRFQAMALNDEYDQLLGENGLQQVVLEIRSHADQDAVAADLVDALGSLAIARTGVTEDEAVEVILEEALAVAEALRHPFLLGTIHNAYATHYYLGQQMLEALNHLLAAVENFLLTDDDRGTVYAMSNLHTTYRILGEFGDAQKILHRALEIAEASADRSLPKEVYATLGNLYRLMGDYDRAENYLRLAIDLDMAVNRNEGRINTSRMYLGMVLREQGRPGEAASIHGQALEIHENDNNSSERLQALLREQLALDYLDLGDIGMASQMLDSAYSESAYGLTLAGQPESLKNRALLYVAQGNSAEAIALLKTSLVANNYVEQTLANRIEANNLLMQAYQQQGDLDLAVEAGMEAIALIRDVGSQLESSRLGPAWSSRTNIIYKQLAELLLTRYYQENDRRYLERAFVLIEQSRSENLIQQRMTNSALDTGSSDESLLLQQQLAAISAERASAEPDDENYRAITLEYYRSLERYQAKIATGEVSRFETDSDFRNLVDRIDDKTLLLEYLCVPDSDCHELSLSNGVLNVRKLGSYAEITLLVNAVNTELHLGNGDATPGIDRLSGLLLGNALPDNMASLVIVADYPLNKIPFAVLGQAVDGGDSHPLMEQFAISYIPSLKAFNLEPAADKEFLIELAIMADPLFSAETVPRLISSADTFRGWVDTLEPLPWSAIEARNLTEIFQQASVRVYTGREANRENLFANETRNARILHLASHAFFNENKSDLVGIALSSSNGNGDNGGDFITLNELQLARFNAELVVISGCETGRGEYLDGEGSMSLARGFLARGANHVISTLWPVSDRASAEFMKYFYQGLHASGLPVSEALQYAQRQLASDIRYRDPFYWAPYILTSITK